MARRNRVDPWGDIQAVTSRGLFTGNRGCLVDDTGQLVRHHNGSLWITCQTEFRDWKHPLGAPRTWTPLFFLDDAVALAAGHRPCGLCRRADYEAFRDAVTLATGSDRPVLAPELNQLIAAERHRSGRGLIRAQDRILFTSDLDSLPTGSVIIDPVTRVPQLVTTHHLRPFGVDGWGLPRERPRRVTVEVLTPKTSVGAMNHGFVPRMHPTGFGQATGRFSPVVSDSRGRK